MLNRTARPLRKKLKALTDPQPEFVSLVFGGANKSPFRAVRSADGTGEGEEMTETSIKAATHTIAKVEFSADKFADVDAVKAWLVEGGYDAETEVTKTESGWMVAGDVKDEDNVSIIDMTDSTGVKIFAITLKSDEVLELTERADDTEVNPGAKDPRFEEMRQRYCGIEACCESHYGEGKTLAEVNENNLGGVPPGLLDLTMALYDAVRNCIKDGDYSGAGSAIEEYRTLLAALTALFPKTNDTSFKAFVDAIAPEAEMAKENEVVETAETEIVEAAKAEVTEAAKAADPIVEGEAPGETVEAEKAADETEIKAEDVVAEGETAEKAEETLVDPILAAIQALSSELTALKADIAERAEKTDQRVAAIEDVRQTRKGADVDETVTASTDTSASKSVDDLRVRSVLGMRRTDSK